MKWINIENEKPDCNWVILASYIDEQEDIVWTIGRMLGNKIEFLYHDTEYGVYCGDSYWEISPEKITHWCAVPSFLSEEDNMQKRIDELEAQVKKNNEFVEKLKPLLAELSKLGKEQNEMVHKMFSDVVRHNQEIPELQQKVSNLEIHLL